MQDSVMYVRLPKELHLQIKAIAEKQERTMAQTVRFALRQYVETYQQFGDPI